MDTFTVVDESECQFKCIGNKSCKSFNVRNDGNNAQRRICELNNKTRQMKPGDFKWKKGSTYYGSVPVSWKMPGTFTFSILVNLAGGNRRAVFENIIGRLVWLQSEHRLILDS